MYRQTHICTTRLPAVKSSSIFSEHSDTTSCTTVRRSSCMCSPALLRCCHVRACVHIRIEACTASVFWLIFTCGLWRISCHVHIMQGRYVVHAQIRRHENCTELAWIHLACTHTTTLYTHTYIHTLTHIYIHDKHIPAWAGSYIGLLSARPWTCAHLSVAAQLSLSAASSGPWRPTACMFHAQTMYVCIYVYI
jgi:hypothetical protein